MSVDWQTAAEVWDLPLRFRAATHDLAYRILGSAGVAWEALATVFASLPALAALQHSYECGQRGIRFSVRGYFRTWLHLRRARRAAYEKTAASIGPRVTRTSSTVVVWLMILMVALVGADARFVALVYLVTLPFLPVLHRIARREGESGRD